MQTYNGTNRMMNKGRSGGRDYKTFERAFDHKLFVSYSEMNYSFSSSLDGPNSNFRLFRCQGHFP